MKRSQKYRTIFFNTCTGLVVGLGVSLWQKQYGPITLLSGLGIGCIVGLIFGIGKSIVTLIWKSRAQ